MDEDRVLSAIQRLETVFTEGQARLAEGQARLTEEIRGIREELARLTVRVDRIADEQKRFAGELARLDETVTRLRVDMMDRMDRFDARLSQVQDEITVTMATAKRSASGLDSTREEMRYLGEEVAGVWRLVRRLQSQLDDFVDKKPSG